MGSLRKQLGGVQQRLGEAKALLKVADPDGFFAPGSAAAQQASQRATIAAKLEQEQVAARERQRTAKLVR